MRTFVVALAIAAATPACAVEAPTAQQIAACRDDALRFCAARLAEGHDAIKACMLAHKPQLSQACREAFAK